MSYGTGSITEIQHKHGTRYRVRIPDGQGGHRSLGVVNSLDEAEHRRAAGLVAIADATTLSGIDLYSYGERYIGRCGLRDARNMQSRWKTIVANAPFARMPIDQVTRGDIREWVRALRDEPARRSVLRDGTREVVQTDQRLSWRTGKHALALLGRVLDEAREEGLVTENIARGIRFPRQEQTSEGWAWLKPDEIEKVFAIDLTDEQRTALTLP